MHHKHYELVWNLLTAAKILIAAKWHEQNYPTLGEQLLKILNPALAVRLTEHSHEKHPKGEGVCVSIYCL